MPADFEYPIVTEGRDKGEPIPFLAQINFRKAPRLAGFPTKGIMQFPKTCDKCKERLMKFYVDFYCNWNPYYRKKILDEIWTARCECDKE